MDVALAILIPVCTTILVVARWLIKGGGTTDLRIQETRALNWMADNYSFDKDVKGRRIVAYFEKHYPDVKEE